MHWCWPYPPTLQLFCTMHTLQIKSSVGLKLFHKPLHDVLVLALRANLRWSKHLPDVVMYCAVLLNVSYS